MLRNYSFQALHGLQIFIVGRILTRYTRESTACTLSRVTDKSLLRMEVNVLTTKVLLMDRILKLFFFLNLKTPTQQKTNNI